MSTKYIARTAIEGGRYWSNQFERKLSTRGERARTRVWLHRAAICADWAESRPPEARQPVRKMFRDKLAPPLRWLKSHIGEQWDDVRGELVRRFDSRTTAGRHILYCHMLQWVAEYGAVQPRWSSTELQVDADGVLVEAPRRQRYRGPWQLLPGKVRRADSVVRAWAKGRRVGVQGPVLFWYLPSGREQKGAAVAHTEAEAYFRQHHRLTDAEVQFWHTLQDEVQKGLWYPRQDG